MEMFRNVASRLQGEKRPSSCHPENGTPYTLKYERMVFPENDGFFRRNLLWKKGRILGFSGPKLQDGVYAMF